jgi:hypothetical protein
MKKKVSTLAVKVNKSLIVVGSSRDETGFREREREREEEEEEEGGGKRGRQQRLRKRERKTKK